MTADGLAGKAVLVTGASGFIGGDLAAALLADGRIEVRALARRPEALAGRFPEGGGKLAVVAGDLARPDSLTGVCEGIDTVFHCAAMGMSPTAAKAPQADYDRVNVAGSLALAREALASGVRRFVFVSSTGAMGAPREAAVTEATACHPKTPYQISKRAAELALQDCLKAGPTELIVLRPCLVVGPGKDHGELLQLFRLCRKGRFPVFGRVLESEKPLLALEDFRRALIGASTDGRPGEIYLVHSGVDHQLGAILAAAGDLLGQPKPTLRLPLALAKLAAVATLPLFRILGRRPPLTRDRLALYLARRRIDIGKARRELHYEPRIQEPLEILRPAYDYYRKTGRL